MKQSMAPASPKTRRPGSMGYPCGEETREALIESAMLLFGIRGYEGASTREIAAGANTTTPGLQYYFKNKEGLYDACIDRMNELFWGHMQDPIRAAERALAARVPDAALIDVFVTLERKLAELMFSSKHAASFFQICFYQEAGLGPEAAYLKLYKTLHLPLRNINCEIFGRLTGRPASHPATVASTLALHGQSLVFFSLRRSALKSLKWDSFDEEHAAFLVKIITGLTQNCLETMVKSRRPGGAKKR